MKWDDEESKTDRCAQDNLDKTAPASLAPICVRPLKVIQFTILVA